MRIRAWRRLLAVVVVTGLLGLSAVACAEEAEVIVRPEADGFLVIGHIADETNFHLLNDSDRNLDVKVVALHGHSITELREALGDGGDLPDWATEAGTLQAEAGKIATAKVDTGEGGYAIIETTGDEALVTALTRAGAEEAAPSTSEGPAVAELPPLPAAGAVGSATGTVNVTMKEFSVVAQPTSTSSGQITFNVKNDGAVVHELVVVRTEGDAAGLPQKGGVVDEANAGLQVVTKIENVAGGASGSGAAGLPAGKYVLLCNVAGHYQAGMHTAFTVQ